MTVPGVVRVYRVGQALQGWSCSKCRVEFPHDGKHLRTFAALIHHTITRHHRLPRPMGTSTSWTESHTVWRVWESDQP